MTALPYRAFCERLGFKLTRAQAVLAAVCFEGIEASSFTGREAEIAGELFGGAQSIPQGARKVVELLKGSRIGGSRMCAMRALQLGLHVPLAGKLAPGEVAYCQIVGPDVRLGAQVLSYVAGALHSDPVLARMIESESAEQIVVRRDDGHRIAFIVLPGSVGGSALRSRTLFCAVMTEASFLRDRNHAVNADECFRAMLPRLTLPGSQLLIESTPWAEAGLVFDLFQANYGHPDTALVARCKTLTMRPSVAMRALVALEERRDEENARREFHAEFLSAGAGLFFERGVVEGSADPGIAPLASLPLGATAWVGADLGLSRDRSACVVVLAWGRQFRIAEIVELKRGTEPLDLRQVVVAFATVAVRFGANRIFADHYMLGEASKRLQELPDGLHPEMAARIRSVQFVPCGEPSVNYTQARDQFRAGLVKMPPEGLFGQLRAQLLLISSQPTSGGGLKIRLPRNRQFGHCDVASAAVVALAAAAGVAPPIPADLWTKCLEVGRQASLSAVNGLAALTGLAGGNSSGWFAPQSPFPVVTNYARFADDFDWSRGGTVTSSADSWGLGGDV